MRSETTPRPIPSSVWDDVEHTLRTIADDSPADSEWSWRIFRLVERAYAFGYDDGHMAGRRETYLVKQFQADREAKAAES